MNNLDAGDPLSSNCRLEFPALRVHPTRNIHSFFLGRRSGTKRFSRLGHNLQILVTIFLLQGLES